MSLNYYFIPQGSYQFYNIEISTASKSMTSHGQSLFYEPSWISETGYIFVVFILLYSFLLVKKSKVYNESVFRADFNIDLMEELNNFLVYIRLNFSRILIIFLIILTILIYPNVVQIENISVSDYNNVLISGWSGDITTDIYVINEHDPLLKDPIITDDYLPKDYLKLLWILADVFPGKRICIKNRNSYKINNLSNQENIKIHYNVDGGKLDSIQVNKTSCSFVRGKTISIQLHYLEEYYGDHLLYADFIIYIIPSPLVYLTKFIFLFFSIGSIIWVWSRTIVFLKKGF